MTAEEYQEWARKRQAECARTNPWAAWNLEDEKQKAEKRAAAQKKAAATRAYHSEAVRAFQAEQAQRFGKPSYYDDRKANDLTRFVLDWLAFHGHYGARINTGGTAVGATGCGGREVLKYTTSGSTKGVADVIACICGRFCQFEIKAGKDRPRPDQLTQQELTRNAGGFYEFIHNADEFVATVGGIITQTI